MIERLKTLYELQLIDNKLDQLEELRGDLPKAVNELSAKMQSLTTQIQEKEEEQKKSAKKIKENEDEIERLKSSQKKFKAQLYQVRNNKEYDALTKEIDHSDEIAVKMESENKALEDLVQKLKIEIEDIKPQIIVLKDELKDKESDLKEIIKANEKEEGKLRAERNKIEAAVKKPDYSAYMRIRKARHGQGIAVINRAACSGCSNVVPAQRQLEIRQNKKIFNCEYCGRILISPEVVDMVNGKK